MKTNCLNIRSTIDSNGINELIVQIPQNNIISLKSEMAALNEALKTGKQFEIEIKPKIKKRSLDSNAYCWVLAGKIAEVIKSTANEVYRQNIRDVGVFEVFPVKKEAAADFIRRWEAQGIGWQVENIGESKLAGYANYKVYFGSSVYNTAEMSRFVDELVTAAHDLGIETLDEIQLKEMINNYEKEINK